MEEELLKSLYHIKEVELSYDEELAAQNLEKLKVNNFNFKTEDGE